MSHNGDMFAQQATLPPLSSLAKPEDLSSFPYFAEASRARYVEGITALWHTVNSSPLDSVPFRVAVMKLVDITTALRNKTNEQEAAQTSLLVVTNARREYNRARNAEQQKAEENDAAFAHMVESIAKDCVATTIEAQRFNEEAEHLFLNAAGTLEFSPSAAKDSQQVTNTSGDTTRVEAVSTVVAEVHDNIEAYLNNLGQTGKGNFSKEDYEGAMTLLDMKAGKTTSGEDMEAAWTLLDVLAGNRTMSEHSDGSVSPKATKTKRQPKWQSLIDLDNVIPTPDQGRAFRKRDHTNLKMYSKKWHPIDDAK